MNPDQFLSLTILTPEGIILEKNALSTVNVPLADGFPLGIKPGHTPLIAETVAGSVIFKSNDEESNIDLYSGVLEIRDNLVTILTSGSKSQTRNTESKTNNNEFDRLLNELLNKLGTKQDIEEK